MQEALRSIKAKLGQYKEIPENGLAVFCGAFTDHEGKDRRIMADIVPLRPIPHSLYKCDSRFHTELLREQLSDDTRYGFVVMYVLSCYSTYTFSDGSCTTFHLLVGDSKQTIYKKEVQLPKKHGRGGQSQNRFARIRDEKRDWYTSEIAETVTKYFIDPATNKVNVKALIVSGSASLKHELIKKLDPRVARAILQTYDVQYSGEAGFNQTLVLCEGDLVDCRYTFERSLLVKFFNAISTDEGLYTFSAKDTIYALEAGAVDTLLVWNELPTLRLEMVKPSTGETKVTYVSPENSKVDQEAEALTEGDQWEVRSSGALLDWLLEHYHEFGSDVQVISNNSSLGTQFVQGFGGIGAILRYTIEMPSEVADESEESEYEY